MLNVTFRELKQSLFTFFFVSTFEIRQLKKIHSSGSNSEDNRTSALKDPMVPCDLKPVPSKTRKPVL